MKRLKYIYILAFMVITSSCGNEEVSEQVVEKMEDPKTQLSSQIGRLEAEMRTSPEINNILAAQAIKAYDDYATAYPDDSLSPEYLFKAAEISTAIQQYPQALTYYEKIGDKYKNYKLIQESLFMKAALLDHYLNDDIKAESAYEELIEKFPSGHYVADAKAAIQNLGKTDAELHEEFKKKNGEK